MHVIDVLVDALVAVDVLVDVLVLVHVVVDVVGCPKIGMYPAPAAAVVQQFKILEYY